MKTLSILPFFIFLFGVLNSKAQSSIEKEAVKKAIENTFLAMENVDSVLLINCFTKEANLQVVVNKNDTVRLVVVPIKDFVKRISQASSGTLHERVVAWESILIDRDMASVWIPYTFHKGDTFSHKGIDVFHLVKFKEGWKICSLMYNSYQ